VAVVHNGIIENFAPLRAELISSGCQFYSQTDTEVVAQLLAAYRGRKAWRRARRCKGAVAA
jgi:glucosamine--fructose-6-phosphate aminotransferase (isomerizing)